MKYNIHVKLLALLTLMMFAINVIPYASAVEGEIAYNADAIRVVTSLGIMENSLSGEFDAEAPVPKGEFTKVLLNSLGIDYSHCGENAEFADITPDSPDYGAVVYAYRLGIISGDGNGRIEADAELTYIQAVKMAVAAMGYSPLAMVNGGYPAGYIKMLESYLDCRIADYGAEFTRGEAAKLIYELLDAPVMEIKGYGNPDPVYNYGSKSSRTLLNMCGYDIYTGILTATPFETTVAGEDFAEEGYISVSGRSFKISGEEDYMYFASEVDVYYSLKNQNSAVCVVPAEGNVVTEILTEDIDRTETDSGKLVYYNESEKIKLKLSDPVMIYNGEGVVFDEELMFAGNGLVRVTKNENSGLCSVVVRIGENAIAAGADNAGNVYLKSPLSDGITVLSDKNGAFAVTGAEGELLSTSEIEAGSVVTVERSRSLSVTRITVCDVKVEGRAQKRDEKLVIDGMEYTALCSTDDVNLRDTYTFYMNYLGQICHIEAETNTEKYGYLLAAGKQDTLGSKLILRIFRTNGSLTEYECSSKLIFNGTPVNTGSTSEVEGVLSSLASTAITQINGEKYQQIIKFTSNSDGYVNSIYTAVSGSHNDGLELSYGYEDRKYRKETECFGDFFINQDTVIFNIPFNPDKQTAVNMSVASGFRFANEETYSTVVYDCDSYHTAGAIVNFTGTVQGGISIDTHVAMFERTSRVVDSEGESAHKIYVYELGKEKSYIVYDDSGIDLTQYSKGDLLKLLVSGGECMAIECDLDIMSAKIPPAEFEKKEGSYSGASYTSGIAHMAQMRKVFGRITAFDEGKLVVEAVSGTDSAKVLAKSSGFGSVTVCDFKNDDIFTVSGDGLGVYACDVNPNARAFVHMRYGAPMSMVIYVFDN